MVKSYPALTKRRASRPPILPTPMKPILRSAIAMLLSRATDSNPPPMTRTARMFAHLACSLNAQLFEDFLRDAEAVHGRRDAAVDRDLQEHFFDIVFRQAICQRASNMRPDLVRTIERGKHGQVTQTSGLSIQTRAAPDLAPTVLGEQFLQRPVEIIGRRECIVYEVGSEDVAPYAESLFKHFFVHISCASFPCGFNAQACIPYNRAQAR